MIIMRPRGGGVNIGQQKENLNPITTIVHEENDIGGLKWNNLAVSIRNKRTRKSKRKILLSLLGSAGDDGDGGGGRTQLLHRQTANKRHASRNSKNNETQNITKDLNNGDTTGYADDDNEEETDGTHCYLLQPSCGFVQNGHVCAIIGKFDCKYMHILVLNNIIS
jgi:hypothetical protein